MSNTFTSIVPKIFAGVLPSLRNSARAVRVCRVDFKNETAQRGSVIDFPVPVAQTATSVTPGVATPATTDVTAATKQITLNQWRRSPIFAITAKEMGEIADGSFKGGQINESVSTVVEEMNAYCLTGMKNASYSYTGTAATAPFGAGVGINSTINVRKLLNIGKAPNGERSLVLDPVAEAAALGVTAISNANERGSADTKSSGMLGQVLGLDHWGDQQTVLHTAGTAAGTLAHGTTIGAVGSSHVYLKASSTGTLKQGDLIHITTASVVYDYVVTADVAAVDTTAAGIEVFVSPPVQVTHVAADTWALTATHRANIGLQRGAFGLAIRPLDPAMLGIGTHVSITDPVTGIALTFSEIPLHMQVGYMVSVLYGASDLRPGWLVRLLG